MARGHIFHEATRVGHRVVCTYDAAKQRVVSNGVVFDTKVLVLERKALAAAPNDALVFLFYTQVCDQKPTINESMRAGSVAARSYDDLNKRHLCNVVRATSQQRPCLLARARVRVKMRAALQQRA